MERWLALCVACVLVVVAPAVQADDDPTRAKLDQVKKEFDAATEKYQVGVASWFDKREETARDKGDKKAVDQIKAERQAFVERGEMPQSVPVALKSRLTTARSTLELAYKTAIGEYTKGKRDNEATAVEKELAGWLSGNPVAAQSIEERIVGKVWATTKVQFEFKRGGAFVTNGKKVGSWAVLGADRVVSVIDEGQFYDVYVFDKEFTSFQGNYIGQTRKEAGLVGKVVRDK